jgi:hypothetical protein
MKKIFSNLNFLMYFSILCITVNINATPIVTLRILDDFISSGEHFDVEIWANNNAIDEDLLGFGFDVYLTDLVFNNHRIESGFFDISDMSYPQMPYIGGLGISSSNNTLLVTLSLTALIQGGGNIAVVDNYDGLSYGLFYEQNGFNINASVPEPSSVALLMFSLITLGGLAYRKKQIPISGDQKDRMRWEN